MKLKQVDLMAVIENFLTLLLLLVAIVAMVSIPIIGGIIATDYGDARKQSLMEEFDKCVEKKTLTEQECKDYYLGGKSE